MQNNALKLLVCLAYSLLVAFSSLEYFYSLPLFLLLFIERKEIKKVFKKLIVLNFFILFLVVFVAFENRILAQELFIRVNMILLFTLCLFFKSKGYDIIRGLNMLKVSPLFITIFYFTLSMIDFLNQELKAVKTTLKARSFKANTSLFSYQTFGNVFGMMFIKAFKKSQELQYSMQSRGFHGQIYLISNNQINDMDILVVSSVIGMYILKGLFI